MKMIASKSDFRKFVSHLLNADDSQRDNRRVETALNVMRVRRLIQDDGDDIHYDTNTLCDGIEAVKNSVIR
jgi:hypothetical protein